MGVLCVDCLKQAQSQARPVRSRLGFTATAGPPLATYALIAINVAVYLLGPVLLGDAFPGSWALWPDATQMDAARYIDVGTEWYRWVTAGFIHFSLLHIGMNMLALWQLGQVLEPALGRWRFVGLYAGSLLGSSAAVEIIGTGGTLTAVGGASGAIFGLLAAYGIILKRLRLPYTQILVIAAIFIGAPLVSDLIPGFGFFAGLSWQGHLGGAIAGAIIMLVMFRGVDRREKAAPPS
ncbi:rhomboid family intramembrane serine protease [Demequina sp. NBRC 110053]|uniref:rhomboid family intramembrane serine protease n=1 Tax=Demequina sp. NBRC 110053 TaxID=1570342 RepID=UPI001186683D|nr:rhomboid family intramembrane serine protease [Demequina sp. NBRC 110053]